MIPEDANELLKQSAQLREEDAEKEAESTFEVGQQTVYIDEVVWTNTKKEPISPMYVLTFHGAEEMNQGRYLDYFLIFSTGPAGDKGASFLRDRAWGFIEALGLSKEDDHLAFIKNLQEEKRCIMVDVSIDKWKDKKTGQMKTRHTVVPVRVLGEDEKVEAGPPPF